MDDWKTSLILSDLQAACNALGGWDEKTYVREPDCIESLKDLVRCLRRDDESFAIRRALGQINVLKTDLLPLLRFYHKDTELFEITTKLIVNLTTPVVLLYKEELPIEKNARNIYMILEDTLRTYKDAFLEKEIWSVMAERLEELMNLNYHERSEDDTETITRILTILRNVLHPVHREELRLKTDGDVSSHDRLLWALHLAGMDDLIIFLCASKMEQSHTLYAIEILHLMLREQEASFLAATGAQRAQEDVQKDGDELTKLREIEKRRKKVELKGVLHNRFSRFSSTYQVRNVKSLGDETRELVVVGDPVKVLQSINNMDFDQKKKFRARAKNRRPEESTSIKRRTTLNIRLFLKEFCSDLLNSAFNALLPQARRAIARAGDTGDEGHYFWVLDFFLEFNRLTGFDIALISDAISKETFHFVQTQMEKCHEMMVTDKRRIHLWMKRLHVDLKTFQQLLKTVAAMAHHSDFQVREAAKLLQQHLFYLPEYRDVALHLLLNFNENVAPVGYLRDLAVTVHIYLRMLEAYSQRGKLKVKDLKKKLPKPRAPAFTALAEDELDQKWLDLSRQLTALLDVEDSQFDYDINMVLEGFHQYEASFHIEVCKHKIVDFLRAGEASAAIGLLRACRRHFAGEECFGESGAGVEAEFMLLRNFFYAHNMSSSEPEDVSQPEEDDVERMQDVDFEDFLKRFANPKVVKAYTLLLSHYNTNSAEVNKVCVKMLHRIAFDLKMSAMLFQAQLFVVFDRILEDYSITPEMPDLKELARFTKYIVQQFVEVAKVNDLALVELLFWKNSAEAYQIQYGYNENEKPKTRPWTEEEELEVKQLFEENNENMAPGQDVIETIQKALSNQTRTRRQIINCLRSMGLVEKGARFKSSGTSSSQPWTGEEEQELQQLYQQFADSIHPLNQIMLNMSVKRPKFRVIEKLLELGCIHDRSEVRKRRVRKNGEVVLPRSVKKKSGGDADPSCISKEFISSSDDSSSDEDVRNIDEDRMAEMTEANTEFLERVRSGEVLSESSRATRTKPKVPKRVKQPKRKIERVADPEQLKKLLSKAVEQRRPAVNWVIESIQDALDEWKDSGNEAVPLVPLVAAEHESVEDDEFCKLLSTFGFVPPQQGIEQYWRIGGDLSRSTLQSRLDILKRAAEGQFENNADEQLVEEEEDISQDSASSDSSENENDESGDSDAVADASASDNAVSPAPRASKKKSAPKASNDQREKTAKRNSKSTTMRKLNLKDFQQQRPDEPHSNPNNELVDQQEDDSHEVDDVSRTSSHDDQSTRKQGDAVLHDTEGDDDTEARVSRATKRSSGSQGHSLERGAKKRRVAIESDSEVEIEATESRDDVPQSPSEASADGERMTADFAPTQKGRKAVIESDDDDDGHEAPASLD